ncbi:hormogonium polysaccharide biosynthesis protein HpsA [Laspinema olomoucense]|uniref:Hormogonium polysaccharide biosynthesis protein HpsA n=1 Tax=Laspinema olomoucense D3b TaxID=2953688 RepID=A0ABT2NC69_9CYAN|nr:hormogonium polysaccharide biosynthesis protein HpsA [Laspinema sp. D3b]MCT7980291.1 hormogonium polysaccharide biosynthesis protein HpsA [Laspinema sp. D3b]
MARKHKIQKALTHLVQAIIRFAQKLTSRDTYRFLRTAFVTSRRRLQAGFVLPTTTLLIIVMMLVVSTLMFRSYQRSTDAISEFQRQEVQNAAAPAIERAKSKLEKLFNANLVAGIPPEALLEQTLLSNDYLFPKENLLAMTAGGQNVPAWSFKVNDEDNDPSNDITVAYTILLRTTRGGVTMDPDREGALTSDQEKADALLVRNGPLITGRTDNPLCQSAGNGEEGQVLEEGWFAPSGGILQKNFQVYAVAIPTSSSNQSISTLQYQQDRYMDRGNKWGAWFRTDLELFPGPTFTWNGAMHTQGSFFVRAKDGFNSFLISSKDSCFYNPALNSDITMAQHLVYSIPSLPSENGNFGGPVNFDRHEAGTAASDPEPEVTNLNNENLDSVTGSLNTAINIALDPVKILTNDSTEPLNRSTAGWAKDDNWENGDLAQRITINNPACPPYVDDTYRADNRYGPKTAYNQAFRDPDDPTKCSIPVGEGSFNYGQPITGEDRLIRNTPPVDQPTGYGLDGYWERRSRGEGLRVIVGQRLELGNPFGWVQDRNRDGTTSDDKIPGDDPLNPNPRLPAHAFPSHEQRQRRTLRDNLAAVQSTAVYFHSQQTGDLPVAFVATTVHPGSPNTLRESATFDRITFARDNDAAFNGLGNTATTPIIATDFFNGRGTNGMEFEGLTAGFQSNAARQTALRNLANFTGDLDSAVGGPIIPSNRPARTMWGNYSNLRRILDSGTAYNALSIADQSTLQTASGTLGMLAYNINYLQAYYYGDTTNTANRDRGLDNVTGANAAGLNALADELWQLQNGSENTAAPTFDYEVIPIPITSPPSPPPPATAYNLPPEAYIAKLEEKRNALVAQNRPATEIQRMNSIVKLARLVMTKEQVERDRFNGFSVSDVNETVSNQTFRVTNSRGVIFQVNTTTTTAPPRNVNIACNLSEPTLPIYANNNFGLGEPLTQPLSATLIPGTPAPLTQGEYVVGLSRLCSNEPKFPSLYYLFPAENHNHDGSVGGPAQPPTEPYIAAPNTANYQSLTPAEIGQIALRPRSLPANWILPSAVANSPLLPAAPNSSDRELIRIVQGATTEYRQVAFKDAALYDGREAMNVRVLNIDLNMLRTTTAPGGGGENWLPATGIVYAFREDAVREDAIARPQGAIMNANAPTDPPLVTLPPPATGSISTKSVDYYPDPDRRPYGFRLKNGSTVRRQANPNNPAGMTFVSDNPVYIQGHFNLHNGAATGAGNTIQEFTQTLGGTPTRQAFYDRRDTQLNPQFANPAQDWWRPTEIMADAVTILSNNFCDGSIEDGIIYAGVSDPKDPSQLSAVDRQKKYGCNTASNYTSYINQNRPATTVNGPWMSENRFDPPTQQDASIPNTTNNHIKSANSPIRIAPSGDPVYCTSTGTNCTDPTNWRVYRVAPDTGTYLRFTQNFSNGKRHINAANTTVNMVMVSGVIPQRLNQINGGFHNFPRLLENWTGRDLFIQGSLIQLNFSNYATGPFSQNAWEPTQTPAANVNPFNYYQPPNRNWGYDVGLQYAPAGPISSRMIVPNSKRDEFYREPEADDPYICKLREALGSGCN